MIQGTYIGFIIHLIYMPDEPPVLRNGWPFHRVGVVSTSRGNSSSCSRNSKGYRESETDKKLALALSNTISLIWGPRNKCNIGDIFDLMGDIYTEVGCHGA